MGDTRVGSLTDREITDAMGFAGYVAESQQSSLGGHAMVVGRSTNRKHAQYDGAFP